MPLTLQEKAWVEFHDRGLRSDRPVEMMNALLDAYAREVRLVEAVRSFVRADPDSAERITTFAHMVSVIGETHDTTRPNR